MNKKQLILALGFAFIGATTLTACDSKKENKAEEVQEQKEDVMDAQKEVNEQQAELDTARKEYREAVADSVKKANP